jgi:MFS family permease
MAADGPIADASVPSAVPPPLSAFDESSLPWWARPFRALRHRDYRLYFLGQLVSLMGTQVQSAALMWLAHEMTGLNKWPAYIATAQILPTCLLGAWGGALADRLPKRALIMATQTAMMFLALLLGFLVYANQLTPKYMLAISIVAGIVNAVDLPARLSFVMDMVGRADLVNAVALNSLLFNATRAAGPVIGGLMLEAIGAGPCFIANGLSFVAVIAALSLMGVSGAPRYKPRDRGGAGLAEGFRHIVEQPGLACVVVMTGMMALLGWPILVLLPGLASQELLLTSGGYTWLLGGFGFGACVAALALATFTARRWRGALLAGAVGSAAAGLFVLSLMRDLPPAVGCSAVAGFGLVLFSATSQSVVQLSTDEHNRGRVLAVWSAVFSGALPLGNWLAGKAADDLGVPDVLRLEAIGSVAAAVAVLVLLFVWKRAR